MHNYSKQVIEENTVPYCSGLFVHVRYYPEHRKRRGKTMARMLNLALDRGNAGTKSATMSGNRCIEISSSSYIATADINKYNAVKAGSATSDGVSMNDLIVEYDGVVYFLGDLAHQGKNATTSFGDLNRYSSLHTKISIMCNAAQIAQKLWPNLPVNELVVNLVMGVPLQAYEAKAKKIKEELAGSYRFTFNGKNIDLHVDSVNVFIEGTGAAVYHGLDKSGKTAVIDSGSFTTGYLWFDGMKVNAEKSDSFKIGVNTALEKLNMLFEQEYDRSLDENELQAILRASIGLGPYPELYAEGKKVNGTLLHEWVRKAISETGDEKNAYISSKWGDGKGKVSAGFREVLHVGGGGYYFHSSLQKLIKSAIQIDDPEKANARGYAILADQIGQRRAAKGA